MNEVQAESVCLDNQKTEQSVPTAISTPVVADSPSSLPTSVADRLKAREQKRLEKKAADKAKRKIRYKAKKAAKQVPPKENVPSPIIVAPPAHLFKPGQSGNPLGRSKSKHVKDALEKILVEAKSVSCTDPEVKTRLQALIKRIYDKAMDEDTDLDQVLEAAKFIADRLDGKPTQDSEAGSGSTGPGPLVINIGTRFAPSQPTKEPEKIEAIDVEVVPTNV